MSGIYYLRAHWYNPQLQIFLSRDPESTLRRYGYTQGNPVMRIDPRGSKFSWARDIGDPLGRFLKNLNAIPGVGGLSRILFSPVMGALQIVADPGDFWEAVKTNRNGIDIFLGLGVAAEVAGGFLDSAFAGYGTSLARRFLSRTVSDVVIGVGQSTAAAAGRGFHHFDWNSFRQGLEYTAGAILWRGVTKFNVRKARVPSAPVANRVSDLDSVPGNADLLNRRSITSDDSGTFSESNKMSQHDDALLNDSNEVSELKPFSNDEIDEILLKDEVRKVKEQSIRGKKFTRKNDTINVKRESDGTRKFRTGNRNAPKVSLLPGFDTIPEDEDSGGAFTNEAGIPAGFIAKSLTE